MGRKDIHPRGFTLIELSIVLVVIGLIVGGVLVGQDLIRAAAVRAQATQIEKFNTAVNTFYGKYGALPGDLNAQVATAFGFLPRGPNPGEGDGNGIIQGWGNANASSNGEGIGETVVFWEDLSYANGQNLNLIEGNFRTGLIAGTNTTISGTALDNYFPQAKIGNGNYVYVYSGGYWTGATWASNGGNHFGLSPISNTDALCGCAHTTPGLKVQQAFAIDAKVDDGLPQSGNVTAIYLNQDIATNWAVWAAGGGAQGANNGASPPAPSNASTAGSSTTCYDNSTSASGTPGVGGNVQHYSVEISNGSNVNCALSFKMQAGD